MPVAWPEVRTPTTVTSVALSPSAAATGANFLTVLDIILSSHKQSAGPRDVNRRYVISDFRLQISDLRRSRRRLFSKHVAEHLQRLGHFFHRAQRDTGVGLLERRKVARDHDMPCEASFAGRPCRRGD